ncbi:MAG: hypothetical protein JEZ11_03560 [Desulfobacterales bacterium]|nr:hypothetical protein [Desulfobacterales bacterium]
MAKCIEIIDKLQIILFEQKISAAVPQTFENLSPHARTDTIEGGHKIDAVLFPVRQTIQQTGIVTIPLDITRHDEGIDKGKGG